MDVSTASYIAGFLDGDGSIHFQLVRQKEYRFGFYIRASVSFSQSTIARSGLEEIQVLVGGLDTVLNFMGFVMVFLAQNPDVRHQLAADPSLIPDAVMELLRRYPIVADAREVRTDQDFEGVHLKKGDMILAPTVLHGLDDAEYDKPLEVRIGRKTPHHTSFGKGVHICPGQYLARLEMRVLFEEWLKRIPDFALEPGTTVQYSGGIDLTVKPYILVWDVASTRS